MIPDCLLVPELPLSDEVEEGGSQEAIRPPGIVRCPVPVSAAWVSYQAGPGCGSRST